MKLLALPPLLVSLALGGVPARAGEVHVPGDFLDLQAGIDGAAPGDVVIVHGGNFGPVVVDKPLTIVGSPPFLMFGGCGSDPACTTCPPPASAFRLEGSGGTLTLANVKIINVDCFWPAPGISGGGFDELHVYSSSINMSTGLTGLGHGTAGIDVDIPFVTLTESQIHAVGSNSDPCVGSLFDDEAAGIRTPDGAVMLVDSTVTGGSSGIGGSLCCASCACPVVPDPALGGPGGPGIVASEIFLAGSSVFGGDGAQFLAYPQGTPKSPGGQPVECGSQPDGRPFVAALVHHFDGVFGGPGSVALGGSYTLAWDLPGSAAVLFFALGTASPLATSFGPGYVALDPATLTYVGPLATGAPRSLTVGIPPAAALTGVELAFQAWDATLGVTRPATALILP